MSGISYEDRAAEESARIKEQHVQLMREQAEREQKPEENADGDGIEAFVFESKEK